MRQLDPVPSLLSVNGWGQPVPSLDPSEFRAVLGPRRFSAFRAGAVRLRELLDGRTFWHFNSTGAGGGVAEILASTLGYARGIGVDARWGVISGSPEFFRLTKRLHNMIHGVPGEPPTAAERATYERVMAANAARLGKELRPGDVVVLHDPQTAGLAQRFVNRGVHVIWRCHIGTEQDGRAAESAWQFLMPYVSKAHGYVFTSPTFVPPELRERPLEFIRPAIDPFSCKNMPLTRAQVVRVLGRAGILDSRNGIPPPARLYYRRWQGAFEVQRQARVFRYGYPPSPEAPTVLQVSRWDRLKDHRGVLHGFASFCAADRTGLRLILAGPAVTGVADDPEGGEVLRDLVCDWCALPAAARARVDIVVLPMDSVEENALIVNALQRHATIVVQKSLQEGFGLTATEALWKARPLIASRVGGLPLQITHQTNGILLDDPSDTGGFARALAQLVHSPALRQRLARGARASVIGTALPTAKLQGYSRLIAQLAAVPVATRPRRAAHA